MMSGASRIQVSETDGRLDVLADAAGKVFALLALIPLLAPYELIWRVQWNDYRHPAFLFAAIISAGAVALSALLVFAAVAGLSPRMTLDAARATFTYSTGAPIVPHRTRLFPLSSLESVHVGAH